MQLGTRLTATESSWHPAYEQPALCFDNYIELERLKRFDQNTPREECRYMLVGLNSYLYIVYHSFVFPSMQCRLSTVASLFRDCHDGHWFSVAVIIPPIHFCRPGQCISSSKPSGNSPRLSLCNVSYLSILVSNFQNISNAIIPSA